ncbi:MAG: NifU family protein, partial [Patescibacteria group bacterium]|nr:NifU family protein [Patescibacteria group bacterium]
MESKIRKALDEIRPTIQADGGDVEFVSVNVTSGVVTVRLQGACAGCALATVTLK